MTGFQTHTSKNCFLCRDDAAEMTLDPGRSATWVVCRDCGDYLIPWDAIDGIAWTPDDTKWKLRIAVREAKDRNDPLWLTKNLFNDPPYYALPTTPLDGHDEIVLNLAKQIKALGHRGNLSTRMYSRFRYRDQAAFQGALSAMEQLGLIDKAGGNNGAVDTALTLDGWRRFKEIDQGRGEGNRAFVAMWFDDSLDSCYTAGIEPALVQTGYLPVMLKHKEHNDKIDDLIVVELRRASLVIADCTGHRPNVYYEAGFAAGQGVTVIHTCRKSEIDDAKFDIRQYKFIGWETPEDLSEKLIARIRATGLSLEREFRGTAPIA